MTLLISIVEFSMVDYSNLLFSMDEASMVDYSTLLFSMDEYSMVDLSTLLISMVELCVIEHSPFVADLTIDWELFSMVEYAMSLHLTPITEESWTIWALYTMLFIMDKLVFSQISG